MISKNILRNSLYPPAVVLGLICTGLGVVRSLGRAGIDVIGLDYKADAAGAKSRYCCSFRCPDPVEEPERLLGYLTELCQVIGHPAALIPTEDHFVLFVSRYREELKDKFSFRLPSRDLVERIVDKGGMADLARESGTPIPHTFFPRSIAEAEKVKDIVEYPAFVKPCQGHLWRRCMSMKRANKGIEVWNPQDLMDAIHAIFSQGIKVVVQSIVPGPDSNLIQFGAYIDHKGEPLAVFCYRKIRQYPPHFGVGSSAESISHPELEKLGLGLLQSIGYCGVAFLEFKEHTRTGEILLIEINPRYTMQSSLVTRSGVNMPLVHYLDLIGANPAPAKRQVNDVRWLNLPFDFLSAWHYYRRGELTAWKWLTSLRGVKAFAYFDVRDPMPFLCEYGTKVLSLPRFLARGWHRR